VLRLVVGYTMTSIITQRVTVTKNSKSPLLAMYGEHNSPAPYTTWLTEWLSVLVISKYIETVIIHYWLLENTI